MMNDKQEDNLVDRCAVSAVTIATRAVVIVDDDKGAVARDIDCTGGSGVVTSPHVEVWVGNTHFHLFSTTWAVI